jgi:hypothetical protein
MGLPLIDFGAVLALSNATSPIPATLGGGTYTVLGTGYNTGTGPNQFGVFHVAAAKGLALIVAATFMAATTVTDERVKLQGTYDGTNWFDLQTVRQDTGVTAAEQVIAAVANSTQYIALETSSEWAAAIKGVRVIGKCTGTAGTGDAITVSAVAPMN